MTFPTGDAPRVKSQRFDVSVPPAIAIQLKELAADQGTSLSKVILQLIIEGLKVVNPGEHPLNRKKD